MAYDQTIPATGHSASEDYSTIRGNFAQLQSSFSINHTPLGSGGGTEGYHTKIYMPLAISDPNLASPASSIYLKTVSAASQLFFQNGNSSTNVVQLTGSILLETGNDGQGGVYSVFQTPWAIKIFIGQTASFSGSRNFTLSGSQTFGSNIYTSLATPFGSGPIAVAFSPNGSLKTFNMQTAGNAPVRWFVMTT